MRMSFTGFAVVLSIIHFASAAYAHTGRMGHRHYGYRSYSERFSYPACQCHFGYDEKSVGACAVSASCVSEGGRCRGHCPPQPQ